MQFWYPEVTIHVCTYSRLHELISTVKSLIQNIVYPRECIHLLVSDDSSPDGYLDKLRRLPEFNYWRTTLLRTPKNSGWGANVNQGLRAISSPFIFFTEDDYVLTRPLDLRLGVGAILAQPRLGMIRYRGTGGTKVRFDQIEVDLKGKIDFEYREYLAYVTYKTTLLVLDHESPELWIYSNGPHLKSSKFHYDVGFYDEGLKLGKTEESFAHRYIDYCRAVNDHLKIAIFPEWVPMHFDHIGKSFQLTEADK